MFLESEFPPDSRVENEAISLIDAGHEVYLFSITYDSRDSEEEINDIHVRRYKGGNWLYKSSALAYQLPYYHRKVQPFIEDFILRNRIESLHIHDMPLAEAVMKVNKNFNLPLVLDLHENRPVIMKHYRHLKSFPGKYIISTKKWERKQPELIRKSDYTIVVTREAKNYYVNEYSIEPQKIIVTPNTIHPEIFLKYPLNNDLLERFKGGFNLVYVGDTSLRRGTDILIEAVVSLRSEIPGIRLILVGTTSEQAKLDQLVHRLEAKDLVYFEGWQDVRLFPSYIKSSDVCVSPLTRNLHHDTTYANKLFQYMAMGKPVIVSNCPAQETVVRECECGLVFEAGNLEDLIDKIRYIYKNKSEADEMGENGRRSVLSQWNWNETSKELIQLYSTISTKKS